ncbi:HPP family protein [Streptomyces sp. T1317-0309]|nr:HPP family protein [Streptomyces sp. T1317-0309]
MRSGARLLVLAVALIAGVGAVGQAVGWALLTTTIGPTAYLLLAHPQAESARLRCCLLGHACATASGLACLAAFGLWHHPSAIEQHHESWRQIAAQTLAVGLTILLLVLLNANHPPAASTALLIASGLARPGPPLYRHVAGLALLFVGVAVVSRFSAPPLLPATAEEWISSALEELAPCAGDSPIAATLRLMVPRRQRGLS